MIPEPITKLQRLMASFPAPWALCGGWAVDAWLGSQTRDHADVDISIFAEDQRALFDHLNETGWQLVAHDALVDDDTSELWIGRLLKLPAHVHGRLEGADTPDRLEDPASMGFGVDIQLDPREGDEWIVNDEPRIGASLARHALISDWGVPTVAPEFLLLFKAREIRPQDETDFTALQLRLDKPARAWLKNAIRRMNPEHPWLGRLDRESGQSG